MKIYKNLAETFRVIFERYFEFWLWALYSFGRKLRTTGSPGNGCTGVIFALKKNINGHYTNSRKIVASFFFSISIAWRVCIKYFFNENLVY